MGAYAAGLLIYVAIIMHSCSVEKAAQIEADAIRDAAKSCIPQRPPEQR